MSLSCLRRRCGPWLGPVWCSLASPGFGPVRRSWCHCRRRRRRFVLGVISGSFVCPGGCSLGWLIVPAFVVVGWLVVPAFVVVCWLIVPCVRWRVGQVCLHSWWFVGQLCFRSWWCSVRSRYASPGFPWYPSPPWYRVIPWAILCPFSLLLLSFLLSPFVRHVCCVLVLV